VRDKTGTRPIRVGLLFGGRSPEHEISITTAASIAREADGARLEVVPIYITREGRWQKLPGAAALARLAGHFAQVGEIAGIPSREVLLRASSAASLVPVRAEPAQAGPDSSGGRPQGQQAEEPIDVLFPALHGQGGEDGSVQGLARLAGLPCVGAGILGSALGMDKISMKRIAQAHGIPTLPFVAFTRADFERDPESVRSAVRASLRLPVFVKPAGAGSSVGITRVRDLAALDHAVRDAARYDTRILAEQGITPRELEVAVLGNDDARASVVGEIIPAGEFYDYRAKYVDAGSRAVIPAEIPARVAEAVRELAVRIFRILDLAGMARVDFLLDRRTGELWFNEVNTIPGFTPISMYPMLWKESGVEYRDLITRLVELAIERHEQTRVETERPRLAAGPPGQDH
jgi:D-alanine-D-alanine ligase